MQKLRTVHQNSSVPKLRPAYPQTDAWTPRLFFAGPQTPEELPQPRPTPLLSATVVGVLDEVGVERSLLLLLLLLLLCSLALYE